MKGTKKLKNSFDEFVDGIDKDRLVLLKKLNEFINTLDNKNNDDVVEAIKNIEFPETPPFPEIPKPPEKIEAKVLNDLNIKKPDWLKLPKFDRIEKLLVSLDKKELKVDQKAVISEIRDIFKQAQLKSNAIAVKLTTSDNRSFYNAMMNAYGTAVSSTTNVATNGATIYNLTMTLANTEYNQALPANTKSFTIQNRGDYDTKIAFTNGDSGSNYLTIKAGQNYFENTVKVSNLTVYAQCATAGQVLEIIVWT